MAYNRSRFVLEVMLDQEYGGRSLPFDAVMAELIHRIREPLRAERIDWYIGGSASVRLLGGDVTPRNIDIGTNRAGVDRIAQLLNEFLIEPVAPTDWPRSGRVHGARAFLGTFREGGRVEWAVPLDRESPPRWGEWTGVPGAACTLEVSYAGEWVYATRPEYALVRSAEKGGRVPSPVIVDVVRRCGLHAELLEVLLSRSSLAPSERTALLAAVRS
ncbi:MAG: nucleotidyltransferase domain-containing protein [Thermoplasmata archaeon]